ncbi:MAG TPA: shikimate kinase [Acidimicrobiales bacterium]|nr:shikimate kinase [Acidimicrobiales bacterium]
MRETSIVLVGMMAVGKTSVGRRLAALRGWEFFDSDRQIETMTGRTVADIWRTDGEPAFRRLEAQVLADALASTTPRIIAAAGGTVLDVNNRRLMALHHPVVWLRAEPELLATRLGTATHRPLLDEDPAGVLARLDAARRPLYEEVADVVVDVDDLTPDQVVTCIEAALEHGAP